ncbi:MAG: GtrA family protein [Alistipes sp.]|nr:GtrA family protein [Alistipes sp.]
MSVAQVLINIVNAFYIKPIERIVSRNTFAYGFCGGLNMTLDIIWYYLIYHYVVAEQYIYIGNQCISPHIASLCIVFPITFFTGFWLNRHVAFRVSHLASRKQLLRYALSVAGSIVINYVCMKLFVELFMFWPTPSKMLTTIVSVVYSYLVTRYYTFADKSTTNNSTDRENDSTNVEDNSTDTQ